MVDAFAVVATHNVPAKTDARLDQPSEPATESSGDPSVGLIEKQFCSVVI